MKNYFLACINASWSCLLIVALLAGCASKSPSVNYYSLASVDKLGVDAVQVSNRDISIGVGPLIVPEYLKRIHLVTRAGDNQYKFSEFHRWAGLIENNVSAVISNNLGLMLQTEKVASFPWLHSFRPDFRVAVEVIEFEGVLDGMAVLSARWMIIDASGEETLAFSKNSYSQPVESPDYAALVRAESLLLADLSRDIALEIKRLTE